MRKQKIPNNELDLAETLIKFLIKNQVFISFLFPRGDSKVHIKMQDSLKEEQAEKTYYTIYCDLL